MKMILAANDLSKYTLLNVGIAKAKCAKIYNFHPEREK